MTFPTFDKMTPQDFCRWCLLEMPKWALFLLSPKGGTPQERIAAARAMQAAIRACMRRFEAEGR
jgi:hypothetical protein